MKAEVRQTRISISPLARTTESQQGMVWLHLGDGLVFRANPIGARIWHGLLEEKSLNAIASDLSLDYGAPREEVEADVQDFLAELASRRLIQMDGKAA